MTLQRFQERRSLASLKPNKGTDLISSLTKATIFAALLVTSSNVLANPTLSCAQVFDAPSSEAAKAAHEAITTDLFNGQVVRAKAFGANNNRTAIFKVTVRNAKSGREREALFKPRPYGDGDGWNRTTMEYVAYELNLLLGMDAVPPVAYRRNFVIDGRSYEGALLYFVPDAHRLEPVAEKDWGVPKDEFLSNARVLDVLLENPDRHIDNFMRGKHWVDGVYRPLLIDHAASLRGNGLRLEHDNPFLTGPVKNVSAKTLEALRRLSLNDLKRFSEFISESEMNQILSRRDQILEDARKLK